MRPPGRPPLTGIDQATANGSPKTGFPEYYLVASRLGRLLQEQAVHFVRKSGSGTEANPVPTAEQPMSASVRQRTSEDVGLLKQVLTVFGDAFDDAETYNGNLPTTEYWHRLLAGDSFIALAALDGADVVGGIAAYELRKFEQDRSEIYIYDLAVAESHRRRGGATALIAELQRVATRRGAGVIFVQADTGPEDQAAIALYTKLGHREEVLHFDIPVGNGDRRVEDANNTTSGDQV